MDSTQAPLLSTPATHIFEEAANVPCEERGSSLKDDQLCIKYEIDRTLAEIRQARYARVALQFPDGMLLDAPRVFELLSRKSRRTDGSRPQKEQLMDSDLDSLKISSDQMPSVRFYILADTSYGACCVDEVAAEHVDADVVVHYGRACLSLTSRIPVIHVFTIQPLDELDVLKQFQGLYKDKSQKIILMADVTYQSHLRRISHILAEHGFESIFMTEILHDPSSPLPNRTVPQEVKANQSKLQDWQLFHISEPPESLLLSLACRVAAIRIFPTTSSTNGLGESYTASTSRALNRRYALLTSTATVSIFGILVNTLSVKNYLDVVDHVKSQILAAGKKSYTFVVGKVNAAKVANFSEIGAWVVIGCWESSLIDSKDFWKPVLTPFELDLALQQDSERVWTGEWNSNFQSVLDKSTRIDDNNAATRANHVVPEHSDASDEEIDSEPESAPPDYDLRTGQYVSHTRPMQASMQSQTHTASDNSSLIKRSRGELASIGGEASPGAEHLIAKQSWKGLGSDFEIAYEETAGALEQGRSGIARGYKSGANDLRT
ncbi:Diphthamide biosynthesis protein 2 [Lecanora helva]